MTRTTAERVSLESSILAAAEHDPSQGQLRLEFRDGTRYAYFGVPPQAFHDLLHADSKGAFFNRHIRSQFKCLRIEP